MVEDFRTSWGHGDMWVVLENVIFFVCFMKNITALYFCLSPTRILRSDYVSGYLDANKHREQRENGMEMMVERLCRCKWSRPVVSEGF